MTARRLVALLVGLVASLGLLVGPASAAVYTPSEGSGTVTDSSPAPGAPFIFGGGGFGPNTVVTIIADGEIIGQVTTDASGRFSSSVVLDGSFCGREDVELDAVGEGADGEERVVTALVTLDCADGSGGTDGGQGGTVGSGGTSGGASAGSGSLPFTGAGAAGPVLWTGVGLLLAGLVFLGVTRRRSAQGWRRTSRSARRMSVSAAAREPAAPGGTGSAVVLQWLVAGLLVTLPLQWKSLADTALGVLRPSHVLGAVLVVLLVRRRGRRWASSGAVLLVVGTARWRRSQPGYSCATDLPRCGRSRSSSWC